MRCSTAIQDGDGCHLGVGEGGVGGNTQGVSDALFEVWVGDGDGGCLCGDGGDPQDGDQCGDEHDGEW